MTWGETATDKLKETTQRDKKVAVSPSRPLNCYAHLYFQKYLIGKNQKLAKAIPTLKVFARQSQRNAALVFSNLKILRKTKFSITALISTDSVIVAVQAT